MNKFLNDGYCLYLWAIPFTLYFIFQLFGSDFYTSGPIILKGLCVFIIPMGFNGIVSSIGLKQDILDDVVSEESPNRRIFIQGLILHIIVGALVLPLTFMPTN